MLKAKPERCVRMKVAQRRARGGARKSADAGFVTHGGVLPVQDKGVF
jgi:hypothetical protein